MASYVSSTMLIFAILINRICTCVCEIKCKYKKMLNLFSYYILLCECGLNYLLISITNSTLDSNFTSSLYTTPFQNSVMKLLTAQV